MRDRPFLRFSKVIVYSFLIFTNIRCGSSSPSKAIEPEKVAPQRPIIPLIDEDPVEPFEISKKIRNEITGDKKFFDFKILSRDSISEQSLLKSLSGLWARQYIKPQKNRSEELVDVTIVDQIVADFTDCGFSYDGPECIENESPGIFLQPELLFVNGKNYFFALADYPKLSIKSALFFPVNFSSSENSLQIKKEVFVFLVPYKDVEDNIIDILEEKSSHLVGKLAFEEITSDTASALAKDTNSPRLYIHMVDWLFSSVKNGIFTPEVNEKINEEMRFLLDERMAFFNEQTNGKLAKKFLDLYASLFSSDIYRAFLRSLILEHTSIMAQQAALRLINYGELGSSEKIDDKIVLTLLGLATDSIILDLFALAINSGDTETSLMAIQTALEFGLETKNLESITLIRNLTHSNLAIAQASYDLLLRQKLPETYIDSFRRNFSNSKLTDLGSILTLDALLFFYPEQYRRELIKLITSKHKHLRQHVHQRLDNIDFTTLSSNDVAGDILELRSSYNSLSNEVDLLVINILDQMTGDLPIAELLNLYENPSDYIRSHIKDILMTKVLVLKHLTQIEKLSNSVYIDVRLATLVMLSRMAVGKVQASSLIIFRLSDFEEEVQNLAMSLLEPRDLTDSAVPAIAAQLNNSNINVVTFVLAVLFPKIKTTAATLALIENFSLPTLDLRELIAKEISLRTLSWQHIDALIAQFNTTTYRDVLFALVGFLGKVQDSQARNFLLENIGNKDEELRSVIYSYTDKFSFSTSHIYILKPFLGHQFLSVRYKAFEYMRKISGDYATEALIDYMTQEDDALRKLFFEEIDSRPVKNLWVYSVARNFQSTMVEVRIKIAEILARNGTSSALTELKNRLKIETDAKVIEAINLAISQF
ncbi:MAG: hypothetical protein KBD78_07595 [Oligoflexales bacterium]|nr:hypothetical protein [Oligoflexales bacterium]